MRIGIAVSCFYDTLSEELVSGALTEGEVLGISSEHIDIKRIPGAGELPLLAQQFAKTKRYDAIIVLGAIIRGETSHYDTVCQRVATGCLQVSLQFDIPVIDQVLTTENKAQALDRLGGNHGHKGREAMITAVRMVEMMRSFVSS